MEQKYRHLVYDVPDGKFVPQNLMKVSTRFKPNASASLIFIRIDLSESISNIISVAVWQENDSAMNYSLQK